MPGDDYLVCIAIDFGTTFSGYAFSMRSNKNEIVMNKNWGADVGFRSYKTSTSILLQPDGNTHSFGFEAENEFTDLDEDERKEGYVLFQRFKMELFSHKKLDSNMKIRSSTGEQKPAVDIIAKALAFMKSHCLGALSRSLASGIAEEYIRWVITVPAIWSDTAKKFMRLAAKQAGIVKDILSQNLIIALEPEAASIYCRTLAMDKFVGMTGAKGDMAIKAGEKYAIVDCGGGTIDITVHEVTGDGKVTEVRGASGGPWGGTNVDRQFFRLLDEIFGTDFMNKLKHDCPNTWLSMIVDFETKKRAAKPGNATGINLSLSLQFVRKFEKYSGEEIEERIKKKRDLGVKCSNGMLRISGKTMQGFHAEIISKILDHLDRIFDEANGSDISKLFIVGGFAESAYLQEFFMLEFGRKATILIPEEAGMAVMKGAVLFGHDTSAITSRIARYHYGVPGRLPFTPGKHDPARKIHRHGQDCINLIAPFVKKGQRIAVDELVEHEFHPRNPDKEEITIGLVSSLEETDDSQHPSVTHLAKITVVSPITKVAKDRTVKVSMRFGGTDILFRAVDVNSGYEAQATIEI